ncbi:MAG: hypothetical protein FWD52_00335 [Candidatus Bathyarchaeota archaeon]|nr:hypothetical protein [Candidatus Termiticorpusculum sp.]
MTEKAAVMSQDDSLLSRINAIEIAQLLTYKEHIQTNLLDRIDKIEKTQTTQTTQLEEINLQLTKHISVQESLTNHYKALLTGVFGVIGGAIITYLLQTL